MEKIRNSINTIFRTVHRYSSRKTREQGLGAGELRTMVYIHRNPGITQKDICDRFDINKGVVARQISSLESRGFIRREDNPEDGRSQLLYATEKAEEFRSVNILQEERIYDYLIFAFTEEDVKELERLLGLLEEKVILERDNNFSGFEKYTGGQQ